MHKSFGSREAALQFVAQGRGKIARPRSPTCFPDEEDEDPRATRPFDDTAPVRITPPLPTPNGGGAIVVNVDGACSNNGSDKIAAGPSGPRAAPVAGAGGFFGPLDRRNFSLRLPPDEPQTNNRGELYACIHALRVLRHEEDQDGLAGRTTTPKRVVLRTDSKYVIEGVARIPELNKKGWRNKDKSDVANQDLFRQLEELIRDRAARVHAAGDQRMRSDTALPAAPPAVSFEHVKGHNGDRDNEAADRLATAGTSPYAAIVPTGSQAAIISTVSA